MNQRELTTSGLNCPDLIGALRVIVEHYWQDEERDYQGTGKEQQRDHIFNALRAVQLFLAESQAAEEQVREEQFREVKR